jgi:hypothetical protein
MKEQILMDNMSEVNDSVGEGQVVVSVRMPSALRDFARDQAKAERRTVSSWIASLVGMAYDTARGEREATMREVMGKLELIHALLVVNGSKAPVKRKETTENIYEMNLTNDDGEEMISRETWADWINHLRKLKKPPSHYTLSLHLEEIKEIFNQPKGWDCNKMIRKIIKSGHASIYLPKGENWD